MANINWYATNMTSNTAPIPLVASSSSIITATYSPWKAFNGTYLNTTDAWHSAATTSAWLQLDFGKTMPVTAFKLRGRPGANPEASPNTFSLKGSNDGSVFNTVFSISGVTWTVGEEKEFILSDLANYRYYRLDVVKPTTGAYVIVGTLQFGYDNSQKILLKNSNNFYTYFNNSWENLETLPTKETILQKGMDLITSAQIAEFETLYGENWVGVQWSEKYLSSKASLYATPIPQILTAKNSIQLTGVESATFNWTATGGSRVAISVDDGTTYHALKNGVWIDVTDNMFSAMTSTEYSALSWEQYKLLAQDSNFLKHQYYIPDSSTVDDILIIASLFGENKIADTKDYLINYSQETKTISIQISKSGTYFANYLDV